MRLYEHEAKTLLKRFHIPVPRRYALLRSMAELAGASLSYPAMFKAQMLVGGRGKAGGIQRVEAASAASVALQQLLELRVGSYTVETVLVEELLEFNGAAYIGVTADPASGNNVFIASPRGGVDIERVAREDPDALLRVELPDNPAELSKQQLQTIVSFLGQPSDSVGAVVSALYRAYQQHDCRVLEVNPLLSTAEGPVAADAKMVVDDNALYRQERILAALGVSGQRHDVAEPSAREKRAAAAGFPYVDLLDEDTSREADKIYVGIVPGGAGYGIFSIDEVKTIGEREFSDRVVPLNFMDSGGGPSRAAVAEMFALLMDYPLVDLIITSRFGGISSCDTFIRGLIDCLRQRRQSGQRIVPVYGRMVGTDLPAAREYLARARTETPEALEPLQMEVGNRRIMARVISAALTDYLAGREGGAS